MLRKGEIKGDPRSCSVPCPPHCSEAVEPLAQAAGSLPSGGSRSHSAWLAPSSGKEVLGPNPQRAYQQPRSLKSPSGQCQAPQTIPASPSHIPQGSCCSSGMVHFLGCSGQVYVDLPSISPCVWVTYTWPWLLLFLSIPIKVHVLGAKASLSFPNSTTGFPLSQLQTPHSGLRLRRDELRASCSIWQYEGLTSLALSTIPVQQSSVPPLPL